MKKLLSITLIISFTSCFGQEEILLDTGKVYGSGTSTTYLTFAIGVKKEPDTIPVLIQCSDTSIIAGKINNKVVWIKGYRVNGDYDTYYLDVLKQRLAKGIIVWLDQNY